MTNILEPVLKSLNVNSLIALAVECLKEVRSKRYEGLAYYEKDATEIALHYLAPLDYSPRPKDTITCMKCGFTVSRPVEGKVRSNCQTCGAVYGREAFL